MRCFRNHACNDPHRIPEMRSDVSLDREAVSSGAYMEGRPVRCLVSFEALLESRRIDPVDALCEFVDRKSEIHKIAREEIELGGVRNSELMI